MNSLYEFLTGPVAWITFTIFIGGMLLRIVYLFGLSRDRDKVFYNHMNLGWASRSIGYWLLPLGSASMRAQPIFAIMAFVFHVCLLVVPLFLLAHNTMWDEAFGVSLWSMPDQWAYILTIVFMITAVFLFFRRLIRPEVRLLTSAWDYTLLILTFIPFLTGFLAYHQWGPYETMLVLHILFAEILLIIIPFSKLGHMILFFFSRAFIGVELGGRRGARSW